MEHMTKAQLAEKLMASMKEQADEQGIDLSDTHYKLGIEDELGVGVRTLGDYIGFAPAIITAMTAGLMLDDAKAKVFVDTLDAMAEPEKNIDFEEVITTDVSFLIEVKISEDFKPELTVEGLTPGGLGVAMHSIHDQGGDDNVSTMVGVLIGARDKYLDGLILTGDREPDFGHMLQEIVTKIAKHKEEESK